ncbi:MAG: T9SS type A sorting domain-containing protein [Bacteroidota bacterium]|nr:T9SS type A sorting domain-containing protein [Bacteroidota bacterium]
MDFDGITRTNSPSMGAFDGSGLSSVDAGNVVAPKIFALEQNYPNPFNPSMQLRFAVPVSGFVSLKVYDIFGKEVTTLVNEVKEAGYYSAMFDASKLSSGIYFAQLISDVNIQHKKMQLIK